MNTTKLISPIQASDCPSFGDWLAEFLPYVAAIVVLAPITLLSLMLWAPFLLVLALVLAPVVVISVLGVAAAVLAAPFVLFHHWEQRIAERKRSPKRAGAVSGRLASVTVAAVRSPGLAQRTSVGGSR